MLPSDLEWLQSCVQTRLERLRASSDLTAELLRRSYEQIDMSEQLLSIEVPKVWPPVPQQGGTQHIAPRGPDAAAASP